MDQRVAVHFRREDAVMTDRSTLTPKEVPKAVTWSSEEELDAMARKLAEEKGISLVDAEREITAPLGEKITRAVDEAELYREDSLPGFNVEWGDEDVSVEDLYYIRDRMIDKVLRRLVGIDTLVPWGSWWTMHQITLDRMDPRRSVDTLINLPGLVEKGEFPEGVLVRHVSARCDVHNERVWRKHIAPDPEYDRMLAEMIKERKEES